MISEYMNDCIHLKACRRFSKVLKSKGVQCSRGCNEDCSAYETLEAFRDENKLYTENEVMECIRGSARDALRGYTDNIISDYI